MAARLPAGVEAFAAGRGHFGQVHRHTAQFSAGREALQQATEQHQQRRPQADGVIAGDQHDQQRAAGHDRQRHDQPFAATDVIDVGPQDDRAQRTHQEACTEHGEGHH